MKKNGNLVTFVNINSLIKIGRVDIIVKSVSKKGVKLCINAPKDVIISKEDVCEQGFKKEEKKK